MARLRDRNLITEIGSRFQAIRRDQGWTQEELAEALDVQPITLSRWERGERAVSLSLLAKAAEALDVPLGDLLDTIRPLPAQPKDPDEKEIVRLYRRMKKERRELTVRVVRELAQK